MEETVTLKPSRQQAWWLVSAYIGLLLVTCLSISSLPFLLLGIVSIALFAAHDCRRFQDGHLKFHIRPDGVITVWQSGIETCYPEYRMYYNRWCMVMKLKNCEQHDSIVITADRFDNAHAYAVARHALLRREESTGAA